MLLITALILIFIVFTAVISKNLNVPLIIIALSIGIIFGSDVTGIIYFDDAILAKQLADIALIFVLFAGGFGTKSANLKPVVKTTFLLSTIGVLLTAQISAIILTLITGWQYTKSLLVCTIISSTDAAAVFSILRSRSINKRLSSITEIESSSNDPVAIVSTVFIIELLIGAKFNTLSAILLFSWQLIGGIGFGVLIGYIGVFLFNKIRDIDVGYFYLFLIGIILLSFGITDLAKASGMLAVFFTGYVMGNKKLPYKNGISSFSETLSFISNVGLFVLLGLLVFPKNFSSVWHLGIILFIIITFIGRPVSVFLCSVFDKLSFKEQAFLSWSGIRGAVPIVLATYPAANGIDKQHQIFNMIFFAVTLSILVQGTTIGKLADILRLSVKSRKKANLAMELVTIKDTDYELIEILIDDEIYLGECRIADLALPVGTTITMINRNNSVIAPSGKTMLYPGDTLSVLVEKNKIQDVTMTILHRFSKII